MVEVAWTAIGLQAATLFGLLFWIGGRIDGLSARVADVNHSLGTRIDGLSARVDSLSARIDSLEQSMNARFDAMNTRLDAHIERHAS